MAFHTDIAQAPLTVRILARLAKVFTTISDAQNRTAVVNRMQSLSDPELSKLGVRREDIVRHVYRDIYYV